MATEDNSAVDVERIDVHAAIKQLFPRGYRPPCRVLSGGFPTSKFGSVEWKPWKKPSPSVPIDKEVSRLVESLETPSPEMRTRAELAAASPQYGFCPYYLARRGVAGAAGIAFDEVAKRQNARKSAFVSRGPKGKLKSQFDYLDEVLSKAKEWADKLDPVWRRERSAHIASATDYLHHLISDSKANDLSGNPETFFLVDGAYNGDSLEKEFLEYKKSLGRFRDFLRHEKARQAPPHAEGYFWRRNFIFGLGYTWDALTGSPREGAAFKSFLDAAYKSLSGDACHIDWYDQIKAALKREAALPPVLHFVF